MGFLTSVNFKSNNFLFISYSHKNEQEVKEFLLRLDKRWINYWYDADLRIGERWNERVKSHLSDSRCLGSIVFVSEAWAISDACEEELLFMKDKGIAVYPVFLETNLNDAAKKKLKDYLDIDDTMLYATNSDASADQLLRTLLDTDVDVVNNFEAIIAKLSKQNKVDEKKGLYYFKIGKYPQNIHETVYEKRNKDEVFYDDYDIKSYLQIPNTYDAYEFEDILWRVIDINRDEIVLLSSASLFSGLGSREEIQKELDVFKRLSGLDKYRVSLLDDKTFNIYKDTIIKSRMHESEYVLKSYRHTENIYFFLSNNQITLINQEYQRMDNGYLSPSSCYGSPILMMKIDVDKEL